jgi:hypothetical protein
MRRKERERLRKEKMHIYYIMPKRKYQNSTWITR